MYKKGDVVRIIGPSFWGICDFIGQVVKVYKEADSAGDCYVILNNGNAGVYNVKSLEPVLCESRQATMDDVKRIMKSCQETIDSVKKQLAEMEEKEKKQSIKSGDMVWVYSRGKTSAFHVEESSMEDDGLHTFVKLKLRVPE